MKARRSGALSQWNNKRKMKMSKSTKIIKHSTLACNHLKTESKVTICAFNSKLNSKIHLVTQHGFISRSGLIGFCAEHKMVTELSLDEAKDLVKTLQESIDTVKHECIRCKTEWCESDLDDQEECPICVTGA